MNFKPNGVYVLKEEFFEKYNDEYLSLNRGKGRPFYYVFPDKIFSGIYWVIPLTSKTDKVNKSIEKFGGNEKKCPYYVINYGVKNSAFNIGNTFPILEKYIDREYINKFSGKHLVIKNTSVISEIERKTDSLIRRNLHMEIKNSVNIKKLIPLLQAEMLTDKIKEIIQPYNVFTENQISFCSRNDSDLKKYKTSIWITEEVISENFKNIKIKENEKPLETEIFGITKDRKPCTVKKKLYNIEQLEINEKAIKIYKEPIKEEKMIEKVKAKGYER